MKNHGVLVTGDTVAQAYRRLYKLERVCRKQVLALAHRTTARGALRRDRGARATRRVRTTRHSRSERERLFFEAMMRVLDRELPGYRE